MKKLLIIITLILTVALFGCQDLSTTETTTEITTMTTEVESTEEVTTAFVYDDRSLVPDSCSHLDNIDDWQPVWCDEFDYEGLPDSTLWSYDTGGGGWGNSELQYYTREDLDNASVSDGTLKITALQENYSTNDYTSARLVSKYKGEWLYGKIQVRAKLPSGDGTWPAIWMLSTDNVYGGWPNSGEIDIMEHVGKDPNMVYGTIHTAAYNHSLGTQIGYSKILPTAETEFHVYELEWEPGRMEVFIDGVSYGVFSYNPVYSAGLENSDAWPFDQRFHLIMNLAIGGSWGGTVDDSIFPQTLEVDYVRVYQKDYEGMDQSAPEAVTDLSLVRNDDESISVSWDKGVDDVMVKEYQIFLNYALAGTTSVNGWTFENLYPGTMYRIDVVALDFAGNRSDETTLNVSTDSLRSVLGIIEAEAYDSQSGIYTEVTEDLTGDRNVTGITTNDYLDYKVLVEESGTYTITYRVASEDAAEIKLYGTYVFPLATTAIPATGGDQIWIDVTSGTFELTAGVYTFRIKASIGGFNLNYIEFKKVS